MVDVKRYVYAKMKGGGLRFLDFYNGGSTQI